MNRSRFLSAPRRRILELIRQIHYGCLETVTIRNGEPDVDGGARYALEMKLGHKEARAKVADLEDFALKDQVVQLFAYFDRVKDTVIDRIEIQNGLPTRIVVRGTLS